MLFCPWTLITKSVCLRTILKILVTKNLTILKLIYKIWHILCSYDDNNIRNTKWNHGIYVQVHTGMLISPYPDQEGKKLLCLSEWLDLLRRLALQGEKKTWWQLASGCCWNRARPCIASELVSFLVGLRTYQHHGTVWKKN